MRILRTAASQVALSDAITPLNEMSPVAAHAESPASYVPINVSSVSSFVRSDSKIVAYSVIVSLTAFTTRSRKLIVSDSIPMKPIDGISVSPYHANAAAEAVDAA